MKSIRSLLKKDLSRNIMITLFFLLCATLISSLMRGTGSMGNLGVVYMIAVVLISRLSTGYLPGIIASILGVSCVSYFFTHPDLGLGFTVDETPFTFMAMLSISIITSATTAHLKDQNRLISEREKLLMEAEKEAMRANLLRAISHDLRTPLTGIIGASSTYLENTGCMSNKEKDELITNINEDANWLLNMVENLLSVTRIRDKGPQVTKQQEPLEEVAAEAIERFHKRLPNAVVQAAVPDELVMVPMDATLIVQVIINLLENAVYHSNSADPIRLTIFIQGDYACFEVHDRGVGIPSERLATLFDGTTSSQASSYDAHKGMGIGLSICKTIVAAHNGTISAANEEQGAVFAFKLPLGENTYE